MGAVSPAANTLTQLYQNGSGQTATGSVTVCNTNATPTTFRLAISTATIAGDVLVANGDFLFYDVPTDGNTTVQLSGLPISNGEVIWAQAANTGVCFQARGFEGTA
jgi:hypothetical protein